MSVSEQKFDEVLKQIIEDYRKKGSISTDALYDILEKLDADPSRIDDLRAALDEFSQLIERYLGASIEARAIVDRSNPEVVIVD